MVAMRLDKSPNAAADQCPLTIDTYFMDVATAIHSFTMKMKLNNLCG